MKDKLDKGVVFFLLGIFPASKFYVPTFRSTLFRFHRVCKYDEFAWVFT